MRDVRLADYRPYPYALERTDLTVRLFPDHGLVEATLSLTPVAGASSPRAAAPATTDAQAGSPLELRGVGLELEALAIDGEPLPPTATHQEEGLLVVLQPPQRPFVLTSRVRIDPYTNTTLEGLYASGGMVTSQ